MKTTLVALVAGSTLLATAFVPAFAARTKCQPGTFYSSKARACVAAGSQKKAEKQCMTVDEQNGIVTVPCSQM
jgi:hypothetical protein